MITFKKILRLIRGKQNDLNETKFTDYQILDAVNECIRYVNQNYALQNSDFLEKKATYGEATMNAAIIAANAELTEGETPTALLDFDVTGVDLPTDYISLVSVRRSSDGYPLSPTSAGQQLTDTEDKYQIFASRIYCGCDFDLLYKAKIAEVTDIVAGTVELPDIFLDSIVKISGMILNNNAETDVLMQVVNDTVEALVPRRRYSNVKTKMPFVV